MRWRPLSVFGDYASTPSICTQQESALEIPCRRRIVSDAGHHNRVHVLLWCLLQNSGRRDGMVENHPVSIFFCRLSDDGDSGYPGRQTQ